MQSTGADAEKFADAHTRSTGELADLDWSAHRRTHDWRAPIPLLEVWDDGKVVSRWIFGVYRHQSSHRESVTRDFHEPISTPSLG